MMRKPFALFALFALLAPLCPGAAAEEVLVIPPGQEELVGRMAGLGESLPGGCSLTGASVDGSHVTLRYGCESGQETVELRPPGAGADVAQTTGKFAIATPGGHASKELVAAIAARVEKHEGSWHWTSVRTDAATGDRGGPPGADAALGGAAPGQRGSERGERAATGGESPDEPAEPPPPMSPLLAWFFILVALAAGAVVVKRLKRRWGGAP